MQTDTGYMECLQLYNVHHNVEIVYNIGTLFVLGEVHNIHRNNSFYQLLHVLHCLLILHQWLQLLLITLLYTLVHAGSQNRNFLQLQNQYPMMT